VSRGQEVRNSCSAGAPSTTREARMPPSPSASLRQTAGPSGVSEPRWKFISSGTLSLSRRRVASRMRQREHVSQPSISQQIHKLEEEPPPSQRYGAPGNQQLFDRRPRSPRSLNFRPIRVRQARSPDSRHAGRNPCLRSAHLLAPQNNIECLKHSTSPMPIIELSRNS